MPEVQLRQPSRCSPLIFSLISCFHLCIEANLTPWKCLPFFLMCYPSRFLRPIPFYWIPCPPWFAVQHYIFFLILETTINLTIYVYYEILIFFTLWCSNALPIVSWPWFNNSPHICIKMLTLELLWLNWFVTCIHVTKGLLE